METYQTSFPLGDESSQMCSLNQRLEAYLSRVKALEEENELLKAEILHLRKEKKTPSARRYHQEVMNLREALDDGYQKMVEAERARDNIYQEIEYVKDLCLQEKQVREEVKKEMSESQKLLEEEKRAQAWLKERLVLLEEEMEEILKVHEEEKAAMEEEILSFSRRLDSFKVAPVAFQPVNVEDYAIKLSQIWQGAVEDYKSEVSDLESSLSEAKENLRKVQDEKKQSQLQLQNLERDLLSLKSRKEMLEEVIGKQWLDQQEEEGRLQLEFETLENEKQDLRAQIAQVLEDRQQLMHLKMSLSLEVATYRSLLEVESTRLYSPTADYKLSSPFGDFVFEKSPLRKRQAESMKTPVAKDYRLISTKRQSAEKSEQWPHTPSRHLNVKSTPFSSKPSPVTKEFQKVSSVLQSQSLKYTKASTNKAATPIPSVKIERRPPTEDVFNTSSYSQGSTKDQPLKRTWYSKNEAELTITEAVENGFVLPDEKEIIAAQVKTDHLESSLKTVKDHHTIVHDTAKKDQQGSLKVDINVKDLELNDEAQGKEDLNVQHIEFNLPTQAFENEESYLVVEKEEVGTCQTVLSEKQEVVQSLEYQNIETLIKEDVKDHLMVPAISEPFTSDAKADLLVATPTHEQENSTAIIPAETEEPKAPSSEAVSEFEPLPQQEQDLVCQISFDLEHAISLSSKLQADQKTEPEPDNASLEKLETESKIQAEESIVDQQIISTLKENNTRLFNEELIEYKGQENEDKESQEDFDLKLAQSESPLEESKDSTNTAEQLSDIKQEICNSKEEIKEESSQEYETEQSSEFVNLVGEANQIPKDSENNKELNQEEQTSLELHSLEQKNKMYNVRKTQIICVTEQMTEQFVVDNNEVVVQLDTTQAENMYLSETGLKEIKKELESLELGEKEQEILDILGTQIGAYEVQVTKLELGEATNQLSDGTEDNVPLFENVDESEHVKQEEQKLSETRDSEQDQSDLAQALDIQLSEDNQNLPDDHATEDVAQLLNDIDDGGQSVDKSKEQFCDIKTDSSIVSETEPVDSLQSFQEEEEEEKYIKMTQTEQQDKLSITQDSLPSESKDDAIEEPQSAHQTSLSFDSAGNDVNAVVEEYAVNQFCELKQDSAQTFAETEDSIPDELKSLEPPVAEEDIRKETDDTITLQKEVIEQPFEEESEPCIKQDIVEEPTTTNTLQENQQEEHKSEDILTESKKTEEDILPNESEQANQELIDSVACAVLREEVELDSPVLADGVQEPEPSFELISDAETKIVFQIESEEITQWTEKAIMHECTFSEQHANANLLAVMPPHEQENSMTPISAETEEPKVPSSDVVSEFEPLPQQEQDFIGQISFDLEHAISLSSKLQVDHKTELEQDNSSLQKLETESKVHEEEAIADQQIIGTLSESNTQLLNDEEVVEDKGQEKEIEELQEDFDLKLAQSESPLEESKDSISQLTDKAIIQELDQEPLSDIQPEIVLQQEDADEESSEGPKEQTSQDNLEITKQDTTEEDEKNSKHFKASEANQEQDLVEESLFGEESQFSLEQKNEVCFSEVIKEEIRKETDEAISETAEHVTTVDSQVESKHFMSPEADQEPALVQEDVSDGKINHQQESVEKHTSEDTKEIISEVDCESVTETVKMDTSEEGSKDSKKTEADQEPELDHEPTSSTEATITDQQESIFDFDNATEEEIIEESSKIVSTIVDNVFSEKNEEIEQLEKAESAVVCTEQQSQATEIKTEKCISGTENTESEAHVGDVEPFGQDQKPELDQEIVLQHEDAGEYSSKDPEEQTSQDNFEKVTDLTKHDTTEEDEQDSKDSKDSDSNKELVKEPLLDSESQLAAEQKNEEVCFSEANEEDVRKENDEAISETAEQDTTAEGQEESKEFVSPEADQEIVLVQEDISDVKISFQQESKEKHISEDTEEKISEVTCETVSETVEKDTSEEIKEESKDSQKKEADKEPEPVHDSLSSAEAKITHQQESVLDFDQETEEEIIEESSEIVSTIVENVFSEKKEVEQLEETESAVVLTEQQSQEPEIKTEKCIGGTENTESDAHLSDVEPFSQESQDPEPDQEPELDQEPISDIQQEIVFQPEDAGEYSSKGPEEQTSQDIFEKVTKMSKQDTTEEDEQDSKDSKDSEDNQGQDRVKESLFDLESQITVEQKNEEVCVSKFTEEDISNETEEAISETAEQDTTTESQVESTDFVSLESDQETVLVQENVSDITISFQQENIEKLACEVTEEILSELNGEAVSDTVGKNTSEENEEDSKVSQKTEADQEPELDHESIDNPEQQESVFDFDKGTEEEIIEESSKIVSTIVETVFSEKNEEVKQLEKAESAVVCTEQKGEAPEIEMEKYIDGTENTEAHLSDVEPLSQESQDPKLDQKTELDQESLSDIQLEIALKHEDADGYSIKSPEEQTSQDNVENVTEMTKQDTLDEVEQYSNDSRVSEVNQGQDLIEEPLFDSESQFTLKQKSEEVCFSEASKEEKSEETDETISETAKLDTTVDKQEESIEFVRLEADQEAVLIQGDVSDVKISYQQKSVETHTSEGTEEKISEVSVSETVAKDASEEHEEDIKDSRKSEAEKKPEIDQESLSSAEAKITDQQESVFDLDKGTDEKICEESSEVISTVENVFSEKKEEVETFEETESAVANTEHESRIPEVETENFISGTENTKSDAHLSDVEPLSQDPEPDGNPELDQEPISEIQQHIALQQEDADEYSSKDSEEQTSQDNLEIVTKIIKQDTTEEDEQVSKDSRDSEANEGQDLLQEPLFDSESQFTVEQKNEEVCFSEATEKKISQETYEVISKTAEQVTTVKIQEDSTDSRDSEVEQGQEIFKEVLPNAQIEETYSCNFTAEAVSQETDDVVSKTAEQEDTFKENEEDQQLANNECDDKENKATTIDQEQESKLPEIGKDDQISGFDNTEERTQDYEPVSKELKDHGVDQELELDADSQKDVEAKVNFQFECEDETHGQTCDVKEINQDIKEVRVILLEQDEFTLISAEHENQCSGSKLEESVSQNINDPEDTIQETVDSNTCLLLTTVVKPDSTVNIYKQETELDSDQCSGAKATSQQGIEDEHLKQSCKDKEVIEETFEVAFTAEDFSLSKENEEVVSSQTKPEDDQNIQFSLIAIQNNLRFTSENDAEVQPECELFLDGAKPSGDLVADDKRAESMDVPHDDITHDSLNKEEGISEEKDFTEIKQETEITEKKEEAIVRETSCQDSAFAPESNNQIQENQAKDLESETNDQVEEKPTETESETILVEHSIEQKLYAENPTVAPDFEGLTEEQSKTEDVETHSNLDDEVSKSDESLDSQDISINSQKSEDFEISKDYQLEQTFPDSTPLPNLDEFEDLVDDKENIVSEEAQHLVESFFLPEPKAEEFDHLELQSSQIATELEAEEPKEKGESLNSLEDILLFSQKSDHFETSDEGQLEKTLPSTTPLSNLTDGSENLAEEQVILEPEPPQTDDGKDFQKDDIEQSGTKETESVSETTEFLSTAEHAESELETPLTNDVTQEESTYTNPEQNVGFSGDDSDSLENSFNSQEDVSISSQKSVIFETSNDGQLEKTLPGTTPLSNLTDESEILSEEQVILEPEQPQTDDGKEFQKDDIEQSGTKESESVSQTTDLISAVEHAESELVNTLNNDVIQEESTYTNAEQNVSFSGDDSDKVEKDVKEDQSELPTKEFTPGPSTEFDADNTEIITDHNRDSTQAQSDESNEGLKSDLFKATNDESLDGEKSEVEAQDKETLEYTQDVTEVIAIATETNVILESDTSISSDESSPNVTAIGQETEPENNRIGTEETPPDVKVKDEIVKVVLEEVEETHEDKAFLTTKPGPEHIEFHASDEEKDTTDEISDSSFDSNSGNEREVTEEQHCSPTENSIHVKTVNGLHGNTIVQATLDLEDYMVNGHSTGEQSKIVISERKTIVKFEEDIINTHTQDIIEESVLKFATSEGKSEGLFQSLLEKSELKEGTRLDESSEIKSTIHTVVEYVDSATDEGIYTKKTLEPYLSDSDFTNQPSLVAEDLVVDKDTNQQIVKTHQEKEDAWSSDE